MVYVLKPPSPKIENLAGTGLRFISLPRVLMKTLLAASSECAPYIKSVKDALSSFEDNGTKVFKVTAADLDGVQIFFIITENSEYEEYDKVDPVKLTNTSTVLASRFAGVLVKDGKNKDLDYSSDLFNRYLSREINVNTHGSKILTRIGEKHKTGKTGSLGVVVDKLNTLENGNTLSVNNFKNFYYFWGFFHPDIENELLKIEGSGIDDLTLSLQISAGILNIPGIKLNVTPKVKLNLYTKATQAGKGLPLASKNTVNMIYNQEDLPEIRYSPDTISAIESFKSTGLNVGSVKELNYFGKAFQVISISFDESSSTLENMQFDTNFLVGTFFDTPITGIYVESYQGKINYSSTLLNKYAKDMSAKAIKKAVDNKAIICRPFADFDTMGGSGAVIDTLYDIESPLTDTSSGTYKTGFLYYIVISKSIQTLVDKYIALGYGTKPALALALGAVVPAVGQPVITA